MGEAIVEEAVVEEPAVEVTSDPLDAMFEEQYANDSTSDKSIVEEAAVEEAAVEEAVSSDLQDLVSVVEAVELATTSEHQGQAVCAEHGLPVPSDFNQQDAADEQDAADDLFGAESVFGDSDDDDAEAVALAPPQNTKSVFGDS